MSFLFLGTTPGDGTGDSRRFAGQKINAILSGVVLSRIITDPPSEPTENDCYIIPAGATGDWEGHETKIAAWQPVYWDQEAEVWDNGGGWLLITPPEGFKISDASNGALLRFRSGAWETLISTPAATTIFKAGPPDSDDDSANTGGNGIVEVNSRCFDTANQEVYLCFDDSVGAAVWVKTTLSSDELGSAAFLNAGTGENEVLKLTENNKLPVLDGSLLVNVPVTGLPVNTVDSTMLKHYATDVSSGDLDTVAITTGWYRGENLTNNPLDADTRWWIIETVAHDADWVTQKAWDFKSSTPEQYIRYKEDGTWNDWVSVSAGGGSSNFEENKLHFQYREPAANYGDAFTSGAWRTPPITDILSDGIADSNVVGNVITLPAGNYWSNVDVMAYGVEYCKSRVQDVDSPATLVLGKMSYLSGTYDAQGAMNCKGDFTLAVETHIEIQARCTSSNYFGIGASVGGTENIYLDGVIWKIG